MDKQSVATYAFQLSNDLQARFVADLMQSTAVTPAQHVDAQLSLQAAWASAKTDARAQVAVQPTAGTPVHSLQKPTPLYHTAAHQVVDPDETAARQRAQPVVTSQSDHQASLQPLRRSARERRKPAVLVESADEADLAAAAYAATVQQCSPNQQEDPFGDLMLLIDAAAALSTDGGLVSPVAGQAARGGSGPGSHQSSSNSHELHSAVAPLQDATYASYDTTNGMAALSVQGSGCLGALDVNGRALVSSRKAQAGRSSSSKQSTAPAGLPPAGSRDRMGTPPADAGAGGAHGTRGNRSSSSRRSLAGSGAAGSAGHSRLGDAAAPPVFKRSSEMTGSLPNLKPRGQGRWQVFLCAQGLKYLYVGQYDDLASAKHARDLAVLAVHGPRLVPTLNPIESYTQEQISAVRQQMAEKPAARAVMVTNGLWPPAGQDIAPETLQQEKRSRRLPGLQHLVPLQVKSEGVVEPPEAQLGLQGTLQAPAAAAVSVNPEHSTDAPSQQVDLDVIGAAEGAPAGSTKAPRMRASVATTLALAAAAASTGGSSTSSHMKMESCPAGSAAAVAAAAAAASLQHYHARATANPTGTTGIREHKGVFEVFLATPPFKYLYVGRAPTLQQAVHLKATAILAIYGPQIAQDQFSIDLNSISSDEVQIMAGKLANKPAALAAMRQYGTDMLLLQQQQLFEQQQQLDLSSRRHSSRDSDAGSHNLQSLGSEGARILAAAVAAAAAMCEDSAAAVAAAGGCRKRSAGGISDAGSAAAAGSSGDMDDLFAAAAAAALKRRNLGSSNGGASSSGGGSTTTAHCLQDLLDCYQQQQQQCDPGMQQYPAAAAPATAEGSADVDQALAAMMAAAAAFQEEGDAEASLTVCPRSSPLPKYESTTLTSSAGAAAAAAAGTAATGIAGVRAHKGGYEAFIASPPFKYLYVGLYKTLEAAVRAKDTAVMVLYGTPASKTSTGLTKLEDQQHSITTDELKQMALKLSRKPQAVQAMKRAGTHHLVTTPYEQEGPSNLQQQQQQEEQQQEEQGMEVVRIGMGVGLEGSVVNGQQQQQQDQVCSYGVDKQQQQQLLQSEGSDQMDVDVLPDFCLQQQVQVV